MQPFYQDQWTTIYGMDCEIGMKELPDNSIDLVCTDPPYHLSDTKPIEDRLKSVIQTFTDIKFPYLNNWNIQVFKYSQLISILRKVPLLQECKIINGIKSWVGVPKSAIDFNCDFIVRQKEIETCTELTSPNIPNTILMDKINIEQSKFLGDFVLDFGNSLDFPISDIQCRNFGEFIDGFYRMFISAIDFPIFPNFESNNSFILFANNFMSNIGTINDSLSKSESSPFVLASWATKHNMVLTFDCTNATGKLSMAYRTLDTNSSRHFITPKLVRTFAGTSCLSTIFEPTTISFIVNTTDGTNSFNFQLWLPPFFNKSISDLNKTVKGFMGKEWDVMPSVAIWKECLRVLKPGAFAFVMSAPRQDVLSRMIVNLQDAGFRTDFTPIFWAFSSGFPKASNIAKLVDKQLGIERETVGLTKGMGKQNPQWNGTENGRSENFFKPEYNKTIATSEQAKALDGSYGGFQPKPAVEVIIVAMKPLSTKTFVAQALDNGKGITWLDGCRIPFDGKPPMGSGKIGDCVVPFGSNDGNPNITPIEGRFPANLLVQDDILSDGKITKSNGSNYNRDESHTNTYGWAKGGIFKSGVHFSDEGSFSRYFSLDKWWEERIKTLPASVQEVYPFLIVPKASKSEKNIGCEELEEKESVSNSIGFDETKRNRNPRQAKSNNNHPTVKPLKLMNYLVTLGSRPNDTVLDSFIGSGTTARACKALNRKCIGFEIDTTQYINIAEHRQDKVQMQLFNE